MGQLGQIAYLIVLPLLLLIGLGYWLQRALGLDMPTLTRLNFYVIVPAMIFMSLVESDLTPGRVGTVVGFSLAVMGAMALVALGLAALRGVPREQWRGLVMSGVFYNAGNYGLPLQQLAFRGIGMGEAAMAVQVFVMIVQNVSTFTFGIMLAAGKGFNRAHLKETWRHMVKFPPLYAWAAASAVILLRNAFGDETGFWTLAVQPFVDTLNYGKGAFIALALLTVGATLGEVKRDGPPYPVSLAVMLRLMVAPLVGLGLIKLLGLSGFEAQVLLVSTATPAAVNCLLLCIEFDYHPEFMARTVFYSTLLSPITVTMVILLAQSGLI